MRGESATALHPFVGLRSFGYADRDFFFGRREQLDALEPLVTRNRFVAIIGSSGSGKSSLVRAGLLPRLENEKPPWRWSEMRPGEAPIRALAECLGRFGGSQDEGAEDPFAEARTDRIELLLRRSSFGIVESIPLLKAARDHKLLILVDQFEELFRFADLDNEAGLTSETGAHRRQEATAFVRLLLVAADRIDLPVHIVLTMRSDFIGECARFHGLPEIVTANQFLVPGLTRDQRAAAICGPVERAGGSIDPELVQRALNDTTEDPDQLPILQHALMRCWQRASKNGADRPHLTANDYKEVGGATSALSVHANEILADPASAAISSASGLSFDVVTKRIFQALTDVDKAGRVVRRPQQFGDLYQCVLLEEDENQEEHDHKAREAVCAVVDRFADPKCSFLRAPPKSDLENGSIIDIGHEALIRRWDKLKGGGEIDWIREEQDDADQYRHLARLARAKATIPVEELATIQRWWLGRKPNRFWAKRYETPRIGEDQTSYFEDVIALLLRSQLKAEELERQKVNAERAEREAFEARLAAQAAEDKRRAEEAWGRQKFRWAIVTSILLSVGSLFIAYFMVQKTQAETEAKRATELKQEIEEKAKQQAQREVTFRSRVMTFAAERILSPGPLSGAADALALLVAKPDGLPNIIQYHRALFDALGELRETRRIADLGTSLGVSFAPTKKFITAIVPRNGAHFLDFWNSDDGAYIDGVRLKSKGFASARWSPDGERILIGSSPTAFIVAPCSSKKLNPYFPACEGKEADEEIPLGTPEDPAAQGFWNKDGTKILTGGFSREAKLWNAATGEFEGIWNVDDGKFNPRRSKSDDPAGGVAFSPDGGRIAVGSTAGEIFIVSAATYRLEKKLARTPENEPASTGMIFSLVFHPKNPDILLATYQSAGARLWNIRSGTSEPLSHAAGGVFQAAFSPDGSFLVTGSEDGTIRAWLMHGDAPSGDEITLRGHRRGVFSLSVAPDGRIVSGSSDGTIRFWSIRSPLSPNSVAETIGIEARQPKWNVGAGAAEMVVSKNGARQIGLQFPRGASRTEFVPVAADVSPDGQFIVVAPKNGRPFAYVKNEEETAPLGRLRGPARHWKGISFIESGSMIAARTDHGETYVWPFPGSIEKLKALAEENLPFEGNERIKAPEDLVCRLTTAGDNCPSAPPAR